jgi:hypothetical protein
MRIIRRHCRAALLILCVGLLSACALLKKPIPLTQLQLALDTQQISWPSDISLGSIQSRAVLKSDRIIVMRGALVMQHEGLRWTSAPEVLLAEQLGILGIVDRARKSPRMDRREQLAREQSTREQSTREQSTREQSTREQLAPEQLARIDIWLNEFNVSVMPDGTSLATVSAAATLKCSTARTAGQLPLERATLLLNSTDPQRVATRFNEAATTVFTQLLKSAAEACRAR